MASSSSSKLIHFQVSQSIFLIDPDYLHCGIRGFGVWFLTIGTSLLQLNFQIGNIYEMVMFGLFLKADGIKIEVQ